jgi:hypothetical protein
MNFRRSKIHNRVDGNKEEAQDGIRHTAKKNVELSKQQSEEEGD